MPVSFIVLLCGMMLFAMAAQGQDSEYSETQFQGKRYLKINLRRLAKFEKQQQHRQEKLVARLIRKERRLKASLLDKDSTAWQRYDAQGLSLDSIAVLAKVDSATSVSRVMKRSNARLDSLRGVSRFLAGLSAQAADAGIYSAKIDGLQGRLEYRKYIDDQITRRTAGLATIRGAGIPAVTGMQKELYYARAQVRSYQALADEPGKLEEKAYEFLQGQAGFDESVNAAVNGGNPLAAGGDMSAAQLERMGYQTRRQLGAALQQKFGNNAGAAQQQLGSQISDWKEKTAGAAAQLKDIKQGVTGIRKTGEPDFKINPMRCLPFRQRIETSYDFQTTRPTVDGRPAMLQLGGMAAYRQTACLNAGVGISATLGLGHGWSNIKFSLEGIGFRTYVSWEGLWRVSTYAGYEVNYRGISPALRNDTQQILPLSTRRFGDFEQSVLIGLAKRYSINSKQSGKILLLYDCWWKKNGNPSPLLIRFSNNLFNSK